MRRIRPGIGSDRALWAVAAMALAASSVVPALLRPIVEGSTLVLVGLSLRIVVRRMGSPALFQPGVMVVAAWAAAGLLAWGQSAVVALAAALTLGALVECVPLLVNRHAEPIGLAAVGLALSVAATALSLPRAAYPPQVVAGIALHGERAVMAVAVGLAAVGAWVCTRWLRGDLGRWLVIWRTAPDLAARSGVRGTVVAAASLALAGALAGAAGWLTALDTGGMPAAAPARAADGMAWLAMALLPRGAAGVVAGAIALTALGNVAEAAGLPALALGAPLTAALWWWKPR